MTNISSTVNVRAIVCTVLVAEVVVVVQPGLTSVRCGIHVNVHSVYMCDTY